MNNLLAAIITKTSDSALSSDVGGRIYLDQAPEGTEYPYIVFFIVVDTPEDVFARDGEDILIQFSLFSTSASVAEIADMYKDLKALFDNCSFSITNNTLIWMRRDSLTTLMDEHTTPSGTIGVKAWHVDYQILTKEGE